MNQIFSACFTNFRFAVYKDLPISVKAYMVFFVLFSDLQAKEIDFDTVFNESRYTWSWDTPKFLSKVTGGIVTIDNSTVHKRDTVSVA